MEPGARYRPTEDDLIPAIVAVCEVFPGAQHIELGSGDGRIVIAMAQAGANSTGYELDEELALKSQRRLLAMGLPNARIVHGDAREADVSTADCVTMWFRGPLLYELLKKLQSEMKPGSRIVRTENPPKVIING